MDWVSEIFKSAIAAPLSSLSVVAGLFFLILSVAKLPKIETSRLGRFVAGVLGIILFAGGATAKGASDLSEKLKNVVPQNVPPAPGGQSSNTNPPGASDYKGSFPREGDQRVTPLVDPVPEIRRGTIQLAYGGDLYACLLQLQIQIGDRSINPTSNPALFTGVPVGAQNYNVTGKILCAGGLITCAATGSGSVQVQDGGIINIGWVGAANNKCNVTLL